ncbi:hypothetical protein Tco_1009358 [Tanacetum coccineum]
MKAAVAQPQNLTPSSATFLRYLYQCCTKNISWVEDIFKKVAKDGIKFCGCATAAFVGVGYGAKLLDTSATTIIYLACLSVLGFYGFSYAQIATSGKYQFWIVIGSPIYVSLCIWGKWKLTAIEAKAKEKAELEATNVVKDEKAKAKAEADAIAIIDEDKRLNQIAKGYVASTNSFIFS